MVLVVQQIIDLPASPPGIQSVVISMNDVVGESVSPFTAQSQVFDWAAQFWEAQIALPPMARADAERWAAFFGLCRGKFNAFMLGDPAGKTPRGTALGVPVVDGAGQSSNVLSTRGWTANQAGVLLAGDYIQCMNRLYKVLEDEDADPAGKASFTIWPDLRQTDVPGDAEPVIVTNAKGKFRLSDNKRSWSTDAALIYGIQFSAREAL